MVTSDVEDDLDVPSFEEEIAVLGGLGRSRQASRRLMDESRCES